MIVKKFIYNIIILITLTYTLKVRKSKIRILIASIIGIIPIPLISDVLMFVFLFKEKGFIVTIETNNDCVTLKPFLDTGLTLEYFNKPVIILNENQLTKYEVKYYVPYKTVDSTSILPIIKTKKVTMNKRCVDILVGVLKMDEIELIVNPKIMEEY